ncbi:glycosyltransferase [Devosia sp. BK]|uniref:glycosyltransferase n=1 Tax=Devosia sp. BK TaxID=2871706 RepID=UPI00293B60AD|nr:glycosyltransferase [Devosia sp. BK]MDV3253789.1 glycosyltransferase [Devosia sp. BK]
MPFPDTDQPLVTVIMPVYNQQTLVAESLRSVLQQSYGNIEILVSDDKSTDGSLDAIRRLLSETDAGSKSVHVIAQPENLGISRHVNNLLSKANGEFIAFFSGDDIMFSEKIDSQVRLMLADPDCTICYHDMEVQDAGSGAVKFRFSDRIPPRQGHMDQLMRHGSFICGAAFMARRKFRIVYCDEQIRFASDWLHQMEWLGANGGTIKYIDRVLGRYRRHSGNTTSSDMSRGFDETLKSIDVARSRLPQLVEAAARREGERRQTYGLYLLLHRHFKKGIAQFTRGVRMSPLSFLDFLSNCLRASRARF